MKRLILPDDASAKASIIEIGRRMYDKNYCAANDGNISCKTEEGCYWVTPSGVSKGFLTEDMLIKADTDGNVLEAGGDYKISSEIQLHMTVYKNREDVNAVVHAHPPASTAFACARKPMDIPVVNEAYLNLGEVLCAPFAAPGTRELAESIIPYLKGHAAVLLANHGAVVWGSDIINAYYRLEILEYYANLLILTGNLPTPVHPLNDEEKAAIESCREKYGVKL